MSYSGYIHIEVERILKETDKAFLFLVDDEEVWIPKNQIANSDDYQEGDANCSISITEWIAKQKGIEEQE